MCKACAELSGVLKETFSGSSPREDRQTRWAQAPKRSKHKAGGCRGTTLVFKSV